LEPDNLLAFLALLGLLRSLETARPACLPRASWTVNSPPVRPVLQVTERLTADGLLTVAAAGLSDLARKHDFGRLQDLKLSPHEATQRLRAAAAGDRYGADLWAALTSDGAVREKGKLRQAEPTPFCLLFGQGHMHFLSRLASIAHQAAPPPRGRRSAKTEISETDCLREALFHPWTRPDATPSFRWDPHEDVRYALRATDPTDAKTKEKTQHGANRLAAIGLSVLTVVPRSWRAGGARLDVLGGSRQRNGYCFTWPIWSHSISLAAIRALLSHPRLDGPAARDAFGVAERRRARRISVGKFMNVTRAEPIETQGGPERGAHS
jgi:hypothetical protein